MQALIDRWTQHGQGHLFGAVASLSESDRQTLVAHLSSVDLDRVLRIHKQTVTAPSASPNVQPLPQAVVSKPTKAHFARGLSEIKLGNVAVVLLAGGQGTRLGTSDPKGCFDIGLPSRKSLFQLQAERIRRVQTLASGIVPLYVMTSPATHQATLDFFKKHEYFGLDKSQVDFFQQGVLPCFDTDGKMMLQSPTSLVVAPDGNGGLYNALPLSAMRARGIVHVHVYCVDNCLVKVCDPAFIGYCAENNADCAAKGVEKKDAGEQVGVVCLCDGKYGVVEYSEIPADLSAKTDDKGGLVLNMANIANHYYTLEFLEKVQKLEMPFHLAHKKIPYWTGSALVKPEKNNGVKLEQFIFDVFPYTSQFKVLAVERASEFSPLKNAKGPDSAETSRNDLMQLHKQYVEQAKGVCAGPVELSPLLTYEGEGLESLAGKTVSGHLE